MEEKNEVEKLEWAKVIYKGQIEDIRFAKKYNCKQYIMANF